MELLEAKKFVVVRYRWRVGAGADFGAVYGWIVVSLTRWNVSLIVLYVVQLFLFIIMGIHKMRRCFFMQLMIFSCQWSRFFSYDKFDLIKFLFNLFSSSKFAASVLSPTLLLKLIFPIRSSKYVGSIEIWFTWSISFDENLLVGSFRALVSSHRRSFSKFEINLFISNILQFFMFFPLKSFNYSFCLEKLWSAREKIDQKK